MEDITGLQTQWKEIYLRTMSGLQVLYNRTFIPCSVRLSFNVMQPFQIAFAMAMILTFAVMDVEAEDVR